MSVLGFYAVLDVIIKTAAWGPWENSAAGESELWPPNGLEGGFGGGCVFVLGGERVVLGDVTSVPTCPAQALMQTSQHLGHRQDERARSPQF